MPAIDKFCEVLKIKPLHFFIEVCSEDFPFTHTSAEKIFKLSGIVNKINYSSRTQYLMVMVRVLKEVKQSVIAKEMFMTQQGYSQLELSKGTASKDSIKKFCKVMEIDSREFIVLADDTSRPLTWLAAAELIAKG